MGVMNEDRLTLYDGLIKTHITNTTVAKETGKGLSTNDYTTDEKTKLAGLNDTLLNKLGESTEGSLTYDGNEITSKADSELSTTSENPVQNKIITVKLNEKADSMVYDESNSKLKLMNGEIVLSEVTVSGGGSASGATIGVLTYESTLIGKEVVLSKDSVTVKTGQFSVGGICTFSGIEEPGTYSLYSTDGTDSNTITVDVTAENIINKTVISCEFYLTPDGETITPVDDVAILLKCAEIKDKSYTTMDELLADEQAMGDITMSENAMKYLARSTGFADAVCANETFMTLLGASSYVDATVLNSDLWVSSIKSSQYWDKIYTKQFTIYGGAYETITIDGYVGSFTTNADGSVVHVLPIGTITLNGSVSGQSFRRTVTNDTTEVYVMPDGKVLYWYGNNVCNSTFVRTSFNTKSSSPTASSISGSTITISVNTSSDSEVGAYLKTSMKWGDITRYKYIVFEADATRSTNNNNKLYVGWEISKINAGDGDLASGVCVWYGPNFTDRILSQNESSKHVSFITNVSDGIANNEISVGTESYINSSDTVYFYMGGYTANMYTLNGTVTIKKCYLTNNI